MDHYGHERFRCQCVAQSMEDVPLEQFNILPSHESSQIEVPRQPRSERETPLRQVLTPSVAGFDITVRVAETETEAGCVRIALAVSGREEEVCVRISSEPVLWQGIRTVDGKRVLIVVGGPTVDALRLVDQNTQQRAEPITLGNAGATATEATSVETADERQYRWVGVAAREVTAASVGIELFANVIEEAPGDDGVSQDAGSLTDEQLDASFPEAMEPDASGQLIVSIGQVPLGD
jgi:hypothetical protein